MSPERRRSDRVMLTIPLVIHGLDLTGSPFEENAHSVSLNRHGARIHVPRPLRVSQTLRLVNQVSRKDAEFRVVGPVAPLSDTGGEWAVEYLKPDDNIWGIQFPPVPEGKSSDSRALLECRKCHTVALLPVSLVEVEVLDTAGIISKSCENCKNPTPWGYAEKQVAMGGPPAEAAMMAEAQAKADEVARGVNRRGHPRLCLQLPILIRDYYGGVEITKSENVSKGGFCFASEKDYFMGQGIVAVCPYSTSSENIEVRAKIVRRHEIKGMHRKLYGVRYESRGG